MTAPKVLVTGAGGFVGEAVVLKLLVDKKFSPIAAVRGASRLHGLCPAVAFDLTHTVLPDLGDVQVVIHAAARVHVTNETCVDALIEFRKVNVEGTLRLARHAVQSGVKRFIFISSIKVNGENTIVGQPFTADDQPRPLDPYAISKFEAEEALMQIGQSTGMEVVIIRPPLVYGPGVKANFLSLLSLANTGIPLPLGAIRNQRSLVAIGNLVSFVITCIDHPRAVNQKFLVSDGQDLSTTQLLQRLSKALGKRVWLLPIPEQLLKLAAFILGKQAVVQRLCGSLQLDIAKNRELLAWVPPVHMHLAMRRTASHFLEKQT
ncbi:SDR family oxidoreductase [Pseudomonas sp. SWRI153]|uniref:SDR family oxidoreductase n=1 Tax=Pseudomonas khorasanensis TaxID=2745508 RepID=A0A923JD65_9PSED|nr:SDR family oxidoreductase [Pseudomonas khorasanensis]MBV4485761.1 SDR family oxidoreductase [Pseudomonas khorasanensis]